MEKKLDQMFEFLNSNRRYNKNLQERFYNSVVSSCSENEDKIISLLYSIANTQSQPKIDKLANTYKAILSSKDCLSSFSNFVKQINSQRSVTLNYANLFDGMKCQDGWGLKTAALFTKCIYHLHNGQYSDHLRIWNDVPNSISKNDDFYLPVDAVIISIFRKIDKTNKWDFIKINKLLKSKYSKEQIEVWDDLWFWGFITQNGSGQTRLFQWNENKYWVLKESDKNPKTILEIKTKAEEFLKILSKVE
jgi:hypothetical protein